MVMVTEKVYPTVDIENSSQSYPLYASWYLVTGGKKHLVAVQAFRSYLL